MSEKLMAAKICNFIIGCIFFEEKMSKKEENNCFTLENARFLSFCGTDSCLMKLREHKTKKELKTVL